MGKKLISHFSTLIFTAKSNKKTVHFGQAKDSCVLTSYKDFVPEIFRILCFKEDKSDRQKQTKVHLLKWEDSAFTGKPLITHQSHLVSQLSDHATGALVLLFCTQCDTAVH